MKKITWEDVQFWIIYGTGLATITVFLIWLTYQLLCLAKTILYFLCEHINPAFGIMCICLIGVFMVCGGDAFWMPIPPPKRKKKAETRR